MHLLSIGFELEFHLIYYGIKSDPYNLIQPEPKNGPSIFAKHSKINKQFVIIFKGRSKDIVYNISRSIYC